jgi:ribonuclease HI
MAEYVALVNGLRITTELRIQQLYIWGDYELIINQVMGESSCHDSVIAIIWWNQKVGREQDGPRR